MGNEFRAAPGAIGLSRGSWFSSRFGKCVPACLTNHQAYEGPRCGALAECYEPHAMAITYRQAGVDIDSGEALVDRIKPLALRTRIPEVVADIGGFAGLCSVPSDIDEPLLVSGTDGVGRPRQHDEP